MEEENLIEAINLKKYFVTGAGILSSILGGKSKIVKAVDGVTLSIKEGEVVGLVGESGCGKTTTGMLLAGLYKPTSGRILYEGKNIQNMSKKEFRKFRREVQMIFQDPYESLNPNFTVYDIVSEPLKAFKIGDPKMQFEKVYKALEAVGLEPQRYMNRYPHQLSGGERQRVSIASAMVLEPRVLIADEPTSMLDVSVRAGILELIRDMVRNMRLSCLFISHDISTVKYISNKTAVMYLGKIIEIQSTKTLITDPLHPYTQALISAIPVPDPDYKRTPISIKGELSVTSSVAIPKSCRFNPRCPNAMDICYKMEPELTEIKPGCFVACHLYKKKMRCEINYSAG